MLDLNAAKSRHSTTGICIRLEVMLPTKLASLLDLRLKRFAPIP